MSQAGTFERCMAVGGVAVFPADTVYGLCCDPANRFAVERLYVLKRRSLDKPSAVMFFDVELALEALPELGERTRAAVTRLLPGGVTLLLPNPAERFPLACGADPRTVGVRVPVVSAAELAGVRWPILQSSANRAGGPDPRRLEDVPELIRVAADLLIDGGELPGTPSTVVDLRGYEASGRWDVVRVGAVPLAVIDSALEGSDGSAGGGLGGSAGGGFGGSAGAGDQYHFDPATYAEMIRADVPGYERLQEELVRGSGTGAARILELGTGTGETARRLLARHPGASLVGIEVSEAMLAVAASALPGSRVDLRAARLEDPLPSGEFDLVASALCVHHLDGPGKAELFRRIAAALRPGGRFVLADVVVPVDPRAAQTPLSPGYDHPSTLADQLAWLGQAGLRPQVSWEEGDLVVLVAERL